MAPERCAPAQWDVLAAELRAYREQQKQTWGEVDNALLGRYLAGEVSADERQAVEIALKDHPELRKLTDVVLDVLNEFQPSSLEKSDQTAQPRLISFTEDRKARRPFLLRERGALAVAASLMLALGIGLFKPESDSVSHTARKRGSEFASAPNPRRASDVFVEDEFPVATVAAVSSIKAVGTPAPAVPLKDIDRVATWTERQLQGPPRVVPARRPEMGVAAPAGADVRRSPEPYRLKKARHPFKGHTRRVRSEYFSSDGKLFASASADKTVKVWDAVTGKEALTLKGLSRAVPYLVQGVRQETEPALQNRCGKALARMAPLANGAIPALTKTLECSNCPKQQQLVVEILANFGPAANAATPILEKLAFTGPANMQATAGRALRRVCVGITDQACVLTPEACRKLNVRVSRLSRQHHCYFSARTLHRPSTEPAWKNARRKQILGKRGLFVTVCASPPTVEVTLGSDLKGKDARLTAESVRKVILVNLRNKNLARGLGQAVELVERSLSR